MRCSDIIIIISRSSGSSSIRFFLPLSFLFHSLCVPFFRQRQSVFRFCAIFMEFSTHNRQIMPLIISRISIQSGAVPCSVSYFAVCGHRIRILIVCPVSLRNSIEFIEGGRVRGKCGIFLELEQQCLRKFAKELRVLR